jgi:hypothetical protein
LLVVRQVKRTESVEFCVHLESFRDIMPCHDACEPPAPISTGPPSSIRAWRVQSFQSVETFAFGG